MGSSKKAMLDGTVIKTVAGIVADNVTYVVPFSSYVCVFYNNGPECNDGGLEPIKRTSVTFIHSLCYDAALRVMENGHAFFFCE